MCVCEEGRDAGVCVCEEGRGVGVCGVLNYSCTYPVRFPVKSTYVNYVYTV